MPRSAARYSAAGLEEIDLDDIRPGDRPLVDRLGSLLSGMEITRRSRSIALQSVFVGTGLSCARMVAAALVHLRPVEGAVLQEAIDVAVIRNALRALRVVPRAAAE